MRVVSRHACRCFLRCQNQYWADFNFFGHTWTPKSDPLCAGDHCGVVLDTTLLGLAHFWNCCYQIKDRVRSISIFCPGDHVGDLFGHRALSVRALMYFQRFPAIANGWLPTGRLQILAQTSFQDDRGTLLQKSIKHWPNRATAVCSQNQFPKW